MSTSFSPKNISPKSALPFSKSIVPPTKQFPRLRSRKGEPRDPVVLDSICRGEGPRLHLVSLLEIGNAPVIYPAVMRWYVAFLAFGIVAFSGCATDVVFNAARAVKASVAV